MGSPNAEADVWYEWEHDLHINVVCVAEEGCESEHCLFGVGIETGRGAGIDDAGGGGVGLGSKGAVDTSFTTSRIRASVVSSFS